MCNCMYQNFMSLWVLSYLGEVLVAGLGLDVADKVAVVAVVGGVQQPQVVAALLAVQLDTEGQVIFV